MDNEKSNFNEFIPDKCPNCGNPLSVNENIDYDETENGYRTALKCGNCDYIYVLDEMTVNEVQEDMAEYFNRDDTLEDEY